MIVILKILASPLPQNFKRCYVYLPMSSLAKYLAAERGRTSELARKLKVSPAAVAQFAQGKVPVKRVPQIARITGIPMHRLRPDLPAIFPPERQTA